MDSDSENSPPSKVLHLSSSTDSPNTHKCLLCLKFKKVFYCRECVRSGQYTKSKGIPCTFTEIEKALLELEENKRTVQKNCLKFLDDKQRYDILLSKIRQAKDRNRIIRLALEEKKHKKMLNSNKFKDMKERNFERNERVKAYRNKCQGLEECVITKRDDIYRHKERLEKTQEDIKKVAKLRVEQLFKYIFPITKIKPSVEMESSDEMIKALAEASKTSFIRNKWVYTDDSNEMKYRIVAPTLPGSGDYSAYRIWGSETREMASGPNVTVESVSQNPTYRIGAALTYAAQLVNVLSFFLNVRLPFKMMYSDFCKMNDQQFTRRTARLNANILYLCITQNVDLSLLHANGTIHNILQMIEGKNADLGRDGPIVVNYQQVSALESSLNGDLKVNEDSDSDEGDSFTIEWEAVPHVQCPEAPAGPATVQSTQMISTQQASSMAGGLMNSAVASVASIWRGFTGR